MESMQKPEEFQVVGESWEANGDPDPDPPQVVGYYSLNKEGELLFDLSQLNYCQLPESNELELKVDLNHGRRVNRTTKDHFYHFLRWIRNNSSKKQGTADGKKQWISPDFACSGSILKSLLVTPFKTTNGWTICACKCRGTIYLKAYETEEEKRANDNKTEQDIKFENWGYAFEQYMLSESPDKPPSFEEPMNEGSFRCIFRSSLGRHSLLYRLEIDGVISKNKLTDPVDWNEQQLVELKVTKILKDDKQEGIFRRYKLLDWRCQSFLAGIKNVLCGYRDDAGVVQKLEKIPVAEMPKRARKESWNDAACRDFCDKFLDWVKSVVVKDCEESVYKFEYHPIKKGEKKVEHPSGKILAEERNSDSEYSFLPKEFITESIGANMI